MRKIREEQSTIFDIQPSHQLGSLFQTISGILDRRPGLSQMVAFNLGTLDAKPTGRKGLSAESILRAAIVKQTQQFSYDELAFHISDSETLRAFCRIGDSAPAKTTLQGGIARITAGTWEEINHAILEIAKSEKVENGRQVRTDATPIETDIHKPYDSDLLGDSVRVMTRWLRGAAKVNPNIRFHDRTRAVKKRVRELWWGGRKVDKKAAYRQLLKHTGETLRAIERALKQPPRVTGMNWPVMVAEGKRLVSLVKQVIDQTERRVLLGEKVPEDEKIFSLFEVHTDIIVKGKREVVFGHKVNLTAGKSGMILDLVVEVGNPADSEKAVEMIERQAEIWGRPPRQCVFDGAYASKANLRKLKEMGVKDVAFTKKRGIKVEEMTGSPWIYRKLRNFRAGVESIISCMKRAFGWTRCKWKGMKHFEAYAWSSAVSYNLLTLARKMTS